MKKANCDIRKEAKAAEIPLWLIANKMGVSEITLIKRLRFELPEVEKAKIRVIISALKEAT